MKKQVLTLLTIVAEIIIILPFLTNR
ncbi:hypothetical protein CGSSp19BS75_11208 [Streptococcus pneumoniae SP19-BS75]|nr:hypothetical protein CGSSp19BS75_11208 [Streptococcus pneumoniae SP19-BS75]